MGERDDDNRGCTPGNDDPFDREYEFGELIPSSFYNSLHTWLTGVGADLLIVLDRKGDRIFSSGLNDQSLVFHCDVPDGPFLDDKGNVIIPLTHEFEVHAWLVVGFAHASVFDDAMKISMGHLVGNMVEQIASANHRILMSSGLHAQVVTDSYHEILKKTELIEKSEKKYRILAQNLEREVLRKTQEVKEAQTHVMHQEKLASIGHLAAGVAHEINNPMGFITSNLRTLKDYCADIRQACDHMTRCLEHMDRSCVEQGETNDGTFDFQDVKAKLIDLDLDYILEDMPQLLDESLEGADRICKIVSDLKDFAHPGEEHAADADLVQCIESTLNMIWNELKYKAQVNRVYQSIPRIYCYPRQLNQVIMNLLMNSAQAIEKQGLIEIGTRDLGDWVEFWVKDNGNGIPEEILPKIFDPFFTTKDVGKGTGLGLNLVYSIVKKHKGLIQVESQPGAGTVFTVRLPVNVTFD